MGKIIRMQSQYRSMQNINQTCSCNLEVIDEPTPPLIHQEARFWLIESGSACVKIQDRVVELDAGDLVSVLPWQVTEVIRVKEQLRCRITVYNYEYFNHLIKSLYNVDDEAFHLTELLNRFSVISLPDDKKPVFERIFDCIQEETGVECLMPEKAGKTSPYLVNQMVSLILEAARCGEESQQTDKRSGEISKAEIFSYLFGHLNEKITLKQLSELFYMSEATISAYITKTTGLSFFDLLNEMRVVRTIDFLSYTDLNLDELAEILGFVDSAHISRVFMARVGMKISEFRKVYDIVRDLSRIKMNEDNYQIVSYVYRNYAEPLTARMVADRFGISVTEMNRILLYFVEMNFSDYLNHVRVNRASQLLSESSRSVLQVAVEVGYSNEKTLTRNFLRYRTMTPGQFRKQMIAAEG